MRDKLVLAGFLAVVILAKIFLIDPPKASQDWAAWVQAFGSIAALLGAVFIMRQQSQAAAKLAADMDHKAQGRRIAAIEGVIENARELVEMLETHTQPIGDFWDYLFSVIQPERVNAALSAMKAVPIYSLESYKMVRGFHEMTVLLEELAPYAELHRNSGDVHYTFEGDALSQVVYLCKKFAEALNLFREGVIDLGHEPTAATNPA